MRGLGTVLFSTLLLAAAGAEPAQAGGFLSKLLARPQDEGKTLWGVYKGVKLLELEVVERPAGPVSDPIARLRFRVRQLNKPDPQYIPPQIRLRQFALSGEQLGHQWLTPNGEGIYEAVVSLREARQHYLYFETGTNLTILKKVPWVVLKSATTVGASD